jgi:hypothetical protein
MDVTKSPTYHTSVEQKIRARNCALQLKTGSPKLIDLLREVIACYYLILDPY